MKKRVIEESRFYEENGEIKAKHISYESDVIDLTPHPTECRVFVKDGEVETIFSEEIINNGGYMGVEIAKAMGHESLRLAWKLYGKEPNAESSLK